MSYSGDIFHMVCRVCAKKSAKTVNLFTIRKKGLILADILAICAQIQIRQTDIRPPNICSECLSHLETAFDLYSRAKLSENQFKKMVATHSKQPIIEVIDLDPIKTEDSTQVDDFMANHDNTPVEIKEDEDNAIIIQKQNESNQPYSNQYQQQTEQEIMFECFMCKASFKTVKDTRFHMKQHSEPMHLACEICALVFTPEQHERHLCKGDSVQCNYCDDTFQTTIEVLNHFRSVHKNQHHPYKCNRCPKTFPLFYLLECHHLLHKKRKKQPLHLREKNQPLDKKEKGTHTCHTCNRTFPFNYKLRKHVQIKHSDYRPHLCSTCGKGFKTAQSLKSHAMRHSEYRPIACPKCPQRFYISSDLKKHMDVHNDKKYVCSLCGSTLNSKHSLEEHTRHLHKKTEEKTCDICSFKCSTISNFKRHMLTHTGEKPHKCTYCDRAFRQSNDLNKHLRSHVGDNTYKCDLCPQAFRLQIELRKHSYEHFQSENQTNEDTDLT